MLLVMHHWATEKDVDKVKETIVGLGLKPVAIPGAERTAVGVIGNQGWIDDAPFREIKAVLEIIHVTKPYKLVSRDFHPGDTVVNIGGRIKVGGNPYVILCERGIRTFEPSTRNTANLSVIPYVKSVSHLPVIFDPSHAIVRRSLVSPMILASMAAGANGVMIEVHTDPEHAMSDGPQSLHFREFEKLLKRVVLMDRFMKKTLKGV